MREALVVVDERAQDLESLYRERYVAFRNGLAPVVGGSERARDVVQEAFARALRQRDQFRGEGSLEAWVWKIAFRVALGERRSRSASLLDEIPDLGLAAPERDPDLDAALRALPPRRRLMVFLRYFADLSYAQIGEVCGVSEGTVAATLAQAHDQLAETLRSEGVTRR